MKTTVLLKPLILGGTADGNWLPLLIPIGVILVVWLAFDLILKKLRRK